jgi:hypothetical protein
LQIIFKIEVQYEMDFPYNSKGYSPSFSKRTRDEDTNIPTQINGRTRKTWLIELGYSSDTRYMDTEKKEQHAEVRKLLAAEGYDVMLLPVVLGSAGTLFKCLDRATKEMDISNARKRIHTVGFTCTVYTLYKPCVPTAILGKTKAICRNKGKNKRQIASLLTPTCPEGQAGKPAYPFTHDGVYFILFFIHLSV